MLVACNLRLATLLVGWLHWLHWLAGCIGVGWLQRCWLHWLHWLHWLVGCIGWLVALVLVGCNVVGWSHWRLLVLVASLLVGCSK